MGYISVNLIGVSSFTGAIVYANGTRYPASGTTTFTGMTKIQADHIWIDQITLASGYSLPWSISYSGSYTSATNSSDRYSTTVNSIVYPTGTTSSPTVVTITCSLAYYYATLSFNANGGSGGPSSVSGYNAGSNVVSIVIPSTTPTRSGYRFDGWQLYYTGGSSVYQPGDVANVQGSTSGITYTLYAIWTQITTNYYASLSYNANGGSGTPSTQYGSNTNNASVSFVISSTTPTRDGYTFLGWSFSSTATSASYTSGQSIALTGNADGYAAYTLYAVWKKVVYSATFVFDANGGTGAPSSVSGSNTASSTVTLTIPAAVPTKSGYTFLGWQLSYTGGSTSYQPGDTASVEGSADGTTYTLIAVWKSKAGGVRICTDDWGKASAHIYSGGWIKATPYIWSDGWKKCT